MVLTSVASTLTAGSAMADDAPAVALTESEQALQEAAASGDRVEVLGERTERETVFANPDGATFTLEKSIVPVRVDTENGWARPDATLVRREDGSIGPKAAVVDLSFSGGGAGEGLVTIGQAGQSVSMGWPGRLPEPTLDGERAVYENVLPDVNLIMTATVEGFRQVLEVETPEAAALPGMKSIEYGLKADGLRLREGAVGSVEALDGNGQVVFRSPSAQMWNSAGDDDVAPVQAAGVNTQSAGSRALSGSPTSGASAQEEASEPVAPPEEGDPLAGPGAGDEAAVMEVELATDSLTVVPDSDLIAATEAEDFPLYIDPSVELNESERTVLSSDGDVFYNFSGGDNGMSVGKCGSAVINGVSYYCGSGYVNRMYFEFTPERLKGKHVLDATFAVTETWSFSCSGRWVDLERTNPISSSSKWPGPAILDQLGDRYVSAGRGTACSPSQPRAVIEFNDNPQETDENLTSTVRSFAEGKLSLLTLMLMAKDETDTVAWKRFDDDAVIRVTYVSKPATPAEHGFPSGSTQICSKSESAPTTVSDPTPILVATPRTVSGGESGAMLRLYFDVDGKNPDGTWFDAPQPTTGSLAPTTGHLSYSTTVKDFPNQAKEWNVALKEGTLYRFTVNTQSYPNTSYTAPLSSGGASWCYFKVDPEAPKPPVVKFNSVYSECVSGACVPGGGPGQAGSLTFSPVAGDVNTHYQYKLSTDVTWSGWKAATSGSYTASITPPVSGSFILNVQAKDSLGRFGESAVKFLVKEGEGPVGRWDFNEASGEAVDRSPTNTALQNNLTLTAAGATRTEHGRRGELTAADGTKSQDKALALTNTSQGAASTTKQVVETHASYTLTAWARLDAAGSAYATVLGQDSGNSSAFYLSYCPDVRTWCVRLPDNAETQRVNALKPPQPKAWTHLGVVVDTTPTTKKISFYVNGVPQGSDDFTTGIWASTGGLQVGRAKYAGSYVDYFPGQIDELAMWQRPLSPEELAVEAGAKDAQHWGYVELVAQYNPAGGSGSSLPDGSGYGNTLTIASGASLNGEDIVLDGVDDSASTARPPLDDTGSFSVSTAVAVDTMKLETMANGARVQVLGQQTGTGSSWGIWFEKTGMQDAEVDAGDDPVIDEETGNVIVKQVPVGRWHFGRLTSNGTGISVHSEELLTPSDEIRLTGVFDSTSQTVRLYVGGAQQGVPLAYQSTVGSGFTVGKGWTGSAWGNYLPGRISDIRLWAGALTNEQQVAAVVGP
ncbi:LamG-like jellyroll fold domain-containing protein [Streptomyces sp. NPDC003035]|uniref:LamG-like jellyroll fold domain-containing protein n=1 Tax=Streptomyces sp. NPDC003035 TaxID=3364676 RepID=UPI00368BDA91